MESRYNHDIVISYCFSIDDLHFNSAADSARLIFWCYPLDKNISTAGKYASKSLVVGPKYFGISNGIHYNCWDKSRYFHQRTLVTSRFLDDNSRLRDIWGDKFIDLIQPIIDERCTVPIFTPDNMYISQDCRHFTKAGATFYAKLLDNRLSAIFNLILDK
jgi:hypothetical protein